MSQQTERVNKLRELMQQQRLDYWYVPSDDPHFSEYVPACWQRRHYISGFTGSAGVALIGLEHAWLWTDSRYFLQAEQELDLELFTLMRQGQDVPLIEWLQQNAAGQSLGLDAQLVSIATNRRLQKALAGKVQLVYTDDNLIDQIWEDRPAMPMAPVVVHPLEYTGCSLKEKIAELRKSHLGMGVDAEIISNLDAIAWLLNLRGSDIACNPVVICYAIVARDQIYLFIEASKISSAVDQYLKENAVTVLPYLQFSNTLASFSGCMLLDPGEDSVYKSLKTSYWVSQQLSDEAIKVEKKSAISLAKALKNQVEQEGMQEAHRRDALALIKFMTWMATQGVLQTEWTAVQKLLEFRQQDPHFKQNSFATICGFADHGAIIHYCVDEESSYPITDQNLLLLDSGGQYDQGTTDTTRMIHLGTPTEGQRHHYTLVLKGHLAVRHAVFPQGTCGAHFNALARAPLWKEKLDFGHGVGHGVGCYLSVHEGPQSISAANTQVPFLLGMMVSNEPGVYFAGQYGIRIENVCVVQQVAASDQSATGHGPFYQLNDLTLVPYNRKLIDQSMLTAQEIKWVDQYHQRIVATLLEDLGEAERDWLQWACQPLRVEAASSMQ